MHLAPAQLEAASRTEGLTQPGRSGPITPRILFVIGQLGLGGTERQLVYLLQTIHRERYRPAVVVWNYREQDPYVSQIAALDVPIYPLPASSSSFEKLFALRRSIRRLRPEVVHSYSFFTNIAAYVGALGSGAVAIGSIRGDYLEETQKSGRLRGRVNAYWPQFQILNSHATLRNSGTALSPFRPRCATVVGNALDLKRFRERPDLTLSGTPIIIGVGSLLRLKRWDRLLRAVAELKRRGLDCQVEIAGDGPMRNSLESLARELGIADRVRFLGHVSRIEDQLCAASLLAHTSDSEGCPNAVMEAMAAGLPVVAADSGDVPRLIDHGRTGFVVRRGDDPALVDALARLLEDPALRRDMGGAARLKAEHEFGLERLVSHTLDTYRAAGWRDVSC